jgi:hypothetical protein
MRLTTSVRRTSCSAAHHCSPRSLTWPQSTKDRELTTRAPSLSTRALSASPTRCNISSAWKDSSTRSSRRRTPDAQASSETNFCGPCRRVRLITTWIWSLSRSKRLWLTRRSRRKCRNTGTPAIVGASVRLQKSNAAVGRCSPARLLCSLCSRRHDRPEVVRHALRRAFRRAPVARQRGHDQLRHQCDALRRTLRRDGRFRVRRSYTKYDTVCLCLPWRVGSREARLS